MQTDLEVLNTGSTDLTVTSAPGEKTNLASGEDGDFYVEAHVSGHGTISIACATTGEVKVTNLSGPTVRVAGQDIAAGESATVPVLHGSAVLVRQVSV